MMPKPAGWALAGGRALPELLFVTCPDKLRAKIGAADASSIASSITAAGKQLLPLSAAQTATVAAAITAVQAALTAQIEGIVLLGGLEVVPSQRIDTLVAALQGIVSRNQDDDQFIVWNDDAYGNRGNVAVPAIPVSRIPDAKSASLMWKSLAAPAPTMTSGRGLRNVARPFADGIYAGVSRAVLPMLTSNPTVSGAIPPYSLAGEEIYLMLHGSDGDGTRFWGEDGSGGYPIATQLCDVPKVDGNIAFTGCCWGALLVTTRASSPGAIVSRGVSDSIALTFLENGGRAFIGCTGTHYSPLAPPYQTYGGPLHAAFWTRLAGGSPPAQALLDAKYLDYAPAIPHGSTAPLDAAIERKILYEFTALGLGW
jgi:hypothetical protein